MLPIDILQAQSARLTGAQAVHREQQHNGTVRLSAGCSPSGVNLFFATGVVLLNLLIDMIYPYLDPRVRYE